MKENETGWLIMGANGQLGRALQSALAARDDVTFWTRDEADLAHPEALKAALEAIRPTAIINASAYTAVDKAEQEPELAMLVNGESVGVLAAFCEERGIPLVHYSTDYVFDGSGDAPWREEDAPAPLNAYGKSKLAGERFIAASRCDYLIFRTSWVYNSEGKNFMNTMLRVGASQEVLNVVSDQFGAPTYAAHLAALSVQALEKALMMPSFPSGIYHLCGRGEAISWHAFTQAIFDKARGVGYTLAVKQVNAIASSAYPTPAMRPKNSRLCMERFEQVFGLQMPDWHDGLNAAIRARQCEGLN